MDWLNPIAVTIIILFFIIFRQFQKVNLQEVAGFYAVVSGFI